MPAERSEFENEVRELVARVLTGVLDGAASTPEELGSASVSVGTGERIAIGADHGGFDLKRALASKLIEAGHAVDDVGTHSDEACDYPDFAHAVARRVAKGK